MRYDGTATDVLTERPQCSFCPNPAAIDGRMKDRTAWAYFCVPCWERYGIGKLGLGFGQRILIDP